MHVFEKVWVLGYKMSGMSGKELRPAWVLGFEGKRAPDERLPALSLCQKNWLARAWEREFGFVPEAIPRYTEERGVFYVPAIKVHWHHIRGVAISVYNDGENPHRPENIVPLSARAHIGKGVGLLEVEDDEEVIHESALAALRNYALYKRLGGRDPFEVMNEEGRLLARRGLTRHFGLWDRHFEELAARVVSNYTVKNPNDLWPKIKRR